LSDTIPIKNGLKHGDALSPFLFNFVLEKAIRMVQVNQESLKLNGTHPHILYADGVDIFGGGLHTIKESIEDLVAAVLEIRMELSSEKTK
jgi:hypothetical protein